MTLKILATVSASWDQVADTEQAKIGPIKHGDFHKWLGKSEDEPITEADIKKGLAAGGHAAKMANFARNAKKWHHSSKVSAAGVKWNTSNWNGEATVKGHKLELRFDQGQVLHGYIDGKLVKTWTQRTYNTWNMAKAFLENEVLDAGAAGTTSKSQLLYVQRVLKHSSTNGWDYEEGSLGDYMGKNKSTSFGVEFSKTIHADKKDTGNKLPNVHNFTIQAFFEPSNPKPGMAIMWLAQGGQIITFGVPAVTFAQGNLAEMIKALKKLMVMPDSEIIRTLYKSNYDNYGRF